MDLSTIEVITLARSRADLAGVGGDVAVMGGGTWLFSEPQDHLRRLVDLTGLGWPSLTLTDEGLEVAATCTVAELADYRLPAGWGAQPVLRQCCEAFLASTKIWRFATIGGNLCLSFPAGPMISLTAGLDGVVEIWRPDGSDYRIPVVEFVTGNLTNVLAPGEVVRSVHLPADALRSRAACRTLALSALGRSAAVLVGRDTPGGGLALTVTAATVRPVQLRFAAWPKAAELAAAVAAIPLAEWHDDDHGPPDWRRAVSGVMAEQIRAELTAPDTGVAR